MLKAIKYAINYTVIRTDFIKCGHAELGTRKTTGGPKNPLAH